MTIDYRTTYSWKESLDLGPQLVRLAEALPDHEQSGLIMQLHQIMLDLPTRVAQDLVADSDTRQEVLYRLGAAVELIDRVYPALDTAAVRSALDALQTRLTGETFSETIEAPVSASAIVVDEPLGGLSPQEAVSEAFDEVPDSSSATPTVAEPTSVAVTPAPDTAATVTPSVNIAVSEPATVNVQPDSVQ